MIMSFSILYYTDINIFVLYIYDWRCAIFWCLFMQFSHRTMICYEKLIFELAPRHKIAWYHFITYKFIYLLSFFFCPLHSRPCCGSFNNKSWSKSDEISQCLVRQLIVIIYKKMIRHKQKDVSDESPWLVIKTYTPCTFIMFMRKVESKE
jgi:hypothetical protein